MVLEHAHQLQHRRHGRAVVGGSVSICYGVVMPHEKDGFSAPASGYAHQDVAQVGHPLQPGIKIGGLVECWFKSQLADLVQDIVPDHFIFLAADGVFYSPDRFEVMPGPFGGKGRWRGIFRNDRRWPVQMSGKPHHGKHAKHEGQAGKEPEGQSFGHKKFV